MKIQGVYNVELAKLVTRVGHSDMIAIVDGGFPFPVSEHTTCIDLAIGKNLPTVSQVLDIMLEELIVEKAIVAQETLDNSIAFYNGIKSVLEKKNQTIEEEIIPHVTFKESILSGGFGKKEIVGYVRTGEFTRFANIILVAGVCF
jgi:D-ribose pyranase